VLESFALQAKSLKPLDPSVKPLLVSPAALEEKVARWKLILNETVVKAARVCSLGSMSHALYDVGGEYRRNM
jgi:hypothetical protein